jgi:hypothetical protein
MSFDHFRQLEKDLCNRIVGPIWRAIAAASLFTHGRLATSHARLCNDQRLSAQRSDFNRGLNSNA